MRPDGTHDGKHCIWRGEVGFPKNRRFGKFSKWEKSYMNKVKRRVLRINTKRADGEAHD